MPDGFVDEPVVGGLDQPVNLAFLPDGRCLVIERVPGRVRLIVDGALSPLDSVLTVDSLKTDNEERGLLRIAVDPSWPARPYAYVYFTHAGRVCPAPDRVVPGQLNRPRALKGCRRLLRCRQSALDFGPPITYECRRTTQAESTTRTRCSDPCEIHRALNPLIGEACMVRSLPIVFGLILIVGYLVLGDILGVVSDRTIAVISGLSSAGTFLDFFVRSTLRTALFLIPALCFLTWGIAPHLRQEYIDRVVTKCARHSLAIVLVLAVVTGLMAFLFATFVIEYHPITSGDEYCYTFQARLLESGRFHAPLPPVIEPFRNRAFVLDEAWYGIGFGGHPLFLVLGLWWGAIYLTPALWAGVSVLLTYMLMRVHHDRGTALLAAIMVSLSPLFLLYHSTLLPESSSLALGLAFLFLVTLGVEKARSWLFLAAALVLALELVTRPQSAIMLGACAGTWLLLRPGVPTGVKRRALAILGIGGVAGVLGLLGYAHLVSGEPFGAHVSPGYHHDELGGARGLGFHSLRDFAQAMANLGVSFVKLNFALLGWPLSWIPLGLWLAHRRKAGWEYALGAAAAGLIAFYFFYRGRQEQYFIEAGHLLIILGALGVVRAYRSATDAPGGWRSPGVLVALVLCSYMLGALSIWPDRVDYFRQRSAPERIVWETIERAGIHRAVVFLDSVPGEFAACVGRNSPDLDDDVILANVRSAAEIPPISRHFPDRACFRMVSTNQGGGLRLLPCEVRAPGSTQDDLSPSLMPDNQEGTAR